MFLLGTGTDLYQEALDSGRLTEDLNMKVGYSDIFISPWCCDSSHEDRYEKLISKIYTLLCFPVSVFGVAFRRFLFLFMDLF